MASLRLTFPEKDQPTVIALTGARLTIGRLPFNTIQIIDRTVSGFHAELISEHGHYRLHDRGSSNGTFVNGQKVADYHLSETCTISFGTVEAQFSPEAVPAGEEAESFPTRSEINAVRQENAELKTTVGALREEVSALRLARPPVNGEVGLVVAKEEFDRVVVEREALKEARLKQDEEITRLKADLAVLKRDRVNLQLAYDGLQRELTDLRAKTSGAGEIAVQPKAAAAVLAAQTPTPSGEVRVEVPLPKPSSAAPVPSTPAAPPSEAPAPAEPVAPVRPKPPMPAPASLPKAPSLPSAAPKLPSAPNLPAKPAVPLPKAPAFAPTAVVKPVAPGATVVAKAPPGLGSGVRPLAAKPLAPADAGNPEAITDAATTRLQPRPAPAVKLPAQPTVKMMPPPAAKSGPKGTQKLS